MPRRFPKYYFSLGIFRFDPAHHGRTSRGCIKASVFRKPWGFWLSTHQQFDIASACFWFN